MQWHKRMFGLVYSNTEEYKTMVPYEKLSDAKENTTPAGNMTENRFNYFNR